MLSRDFSKQADLFKVLSDPHRLKILSALARTGDELCVCDLASGLYLVQPTVSHHLRVLREAGLVTSERRATWVYYRLAPHAMEKMRDAIERLHSVRPSRASISR